MHRNTQCVAIVQGAASEAGPVDGFFQSISPEEGGRLINDVQRLGNQVELLTSVVSDLVEQNQWLSRELKSRERSQGLSLFSSGSKSRAPSPTG